MNKSPSDVPSICKSCLILFDKPGILFLPIDLDEEQKILQNEHPEQRKEKVRELCFLIVIYHPKVETRPTLISVHKFIRSITSI